MAEILIVAAISAAVSAAEYTLSYLLTPKQKPQERGLLQGQFQVQDSAYGGMIPLVYGGPQDYTATASSVTDAFTVAGGHSFIAGQTVTLASTGALPSPLATATVYYVRDVTSTTFRVAAAAGGAAIDLTDAGGGTITVSDAGAHGFRLAGNVIYLSDIRRFQTQTTERQGSGKGARTTQIINDNYEADVAVMFGEGELELLALYADTDLIFDSRQTITGAVNPSPVVPSPYNPLHPPHPVTDPDFPAYPDTNFSETPAPDTNGTTSATVVGGMYAQMRFYAGTQTQEPDPVIEAYCQEVFAADYALGRDVAPAYRGRSYVVLEKFNLSNYQRVPQFLAILRNKSLRTAKQILEDLAARSNAQASDYDFTALAPLYVRGMGVTSPASLKQISSTTLQVRWGFDFAQRGGAVTAVMRGGGADYHVPPDHLGFGPRGGGGGGERPKLVRTSVKLNDTELPRQIDLTAYNVTKEMQPVTRSWRRTETGSFTPTAVSLEMSLSPEEVTEVARRLGETTWTEGRYAVELSLPHQYLVAAASTVLEVDDGDTTVTVRVSERTGSIPGSLDFKGVFVAQAQYHEPTIPVPVFNPPPVFYPPTVVGQFAETDYLNPEEREAGAVGYYVGVASYEQNAFRGCAVKEDKGAGYELVANLSKLALVGVCATTLAATNAGTETVDADLYGSQEPTPAFTDDEIAAGKGRLLVGSERLQYKTATKLGGFANRWRFSDLVNRAQDLTARSGHTSNERLLLLDDALVFVAVDRSEAGVARDFKFVPVGMDETATPVTSYTFTGAAFIPAASNLRLSRLDGSTGSPLTALWDRGRRGGSLGTDARAEVYRVRIIDVLTGEVKREHFVSTGYSEPLSWQHLFGAVIGTVAEDGTLSTTGDATHTEDFRATQVIYGDSVSHFNLGTHYPPLQFRLVGATVPCARDAATDEIVAADHYWQEGDQVVFNSASPLSGAYYVRNPTGDRFQVSSTPTGSIVSLAGTPPSFTMSYPALVPSPAFCSLDAVVSSSLLYLRPCSVAFDSYKRLAVAGTPCAIEVASGGIRFYVGDLERPIFTAEVGAVRFPYMVEATLGQLSGEAQDALQVRVDHTQARSFTYTRAMQEKDWGVGSIPPAVKVEVCQMFDGEPGLASSAIG